MSKFRKTLEIPLNVHIRALKIAKELGLSYTAFIVQALDSEVNKQISIKYNQNENRD